MRKLALLVAMLAMVLAAAIPAFAQRQEGDGQEGEEDCIQLTHPATPCLPQEEAGGAEPVEATTPEEVGAEPVEATVPSQDAPAEAAAASGPGGGATVEEFVCFRSTGDKIRLGTGKVVTTPSGNVNVVCTGQSF